MLWTRLLGTRRAPLDDEVDVVWEVATDEAFTAVASSGTYRARAAQGHSVHVTVELDGPAWYRFRAGGWDSPAGRVAPTPRDGDHDTLRIAATNCQNFRTW